MVCYQDALRDSPFYPSCLSPDQKEHVEWIAVPIVLQSELECGARACLHGVVFVLSNINHNRIMYELQHMTDSANLS